MGEQWRMALALLSEIREAKLKPEVSHNAEEQRVSERWSVAAGFCAGDRDVGGDVGIRTLSELERCDHWVQERTSSGSRRRRCSARCGWQCWSPNAITNCSAGVRAC
ncbi:unnamed protein product [Prorocentrum cordatum]|uniref:Uncharacterized protein n=1 Tax=Prorocentrum cordatum TaxID=2364126 RepID=A0ABN9TKI3_9DINO|nr:unnamed protein product [Polarella glacialis]